VSVDRTLKSQIARYDAAVVDTNDNQDYKIHSLVTSRMAEEWIHSALLFSFPSFLLLKSQSFPPKILFYVFIKNILSVYLFDLFTFAN
jgi:hypothetical protein